MAEFLIPTADEKGHICPDCVEQLHSMIVDYHKHINGGGKNQQAGKGIVMKNVP